MPSPKWSISLVNNEVYEHQNCHVGQNIVCLVQYSRFDNVLFKSEV